MATDGKFTKDSARFQAIKAVIESKDGKAIAKEAAKNGVPPLCALDQLLRETIVAYKGADDSTRNAGWIIADMMRAFGYIEAGKAVCHPHGSVAKSGKLWKPENSN